MFFFLRYRRHFAKLSLLSFYSYFGYTATFFTQVLGVAYNTLMVW